MQARGQERASRSEPDRAAKRDRRRRHGGRSPAARCDRGGDDRACRSRRRSAARSRARGGISARGIDLDTTDPVASGACLADRPSTPEIAAAIDEWCRIRRTRLDDSRSRRLNEVARAADPDPWRNAVRDQYDRSTADSLPALRARADDVQALEKQPVNSLLLLSVMLMEAEDRPTATKILQVANRRFPDHFRVCLLQGSLSISESPTADKAEAARSTASAVAQRPDSPLAHINRGFALQMAKKFDEATNEFPRGDPAQAKLCQGSRRLRTGPVATGKTH